MNFIWSDFGILNKCHIESDGYLYVHNTNNDFRKMSPKYQAIFGKIEHKCKLLNGKSVQIRTSQNTGSWSTNVWFSDLSLSDTHVKTTAPSMNSVEEIDDLNDKISDWLVDLKKSINTAKVGTPFQYKGESWVKTDCLDAWSADKGYYILAEDGMEPFPAQILPTPGHRFIIMPQNGSGLDKLLCPNLKTLARRK